MIHPSNYLIYVLIYKKYKRLVIFPLMYGAYFDDIDKEHEYIKKLVEIIGCEKPLELEKVSHKVFKSGPDYYEMEGDVNLKIEYSKLNKKL